MMTTVVVPMSSLRDGQETLFSSFRTSRMNSMPLLMRSLLFSKNSFIDRQLCGASPLQRSGRPGGTRTPNMRFWRPPLYQFELLACSLQKAIYRVSLCTVWARHRLQNFLSSSRSVVTFLFLVDV